MRNRSLEEREESEALEQPAEEHVATATGHATPGHGEAGHAAAEHGGWGHTAEDNDISEQERSELLNSIAHATHPICEVSLSKEIRNLDCMFHLFPNVNPPYISFHFSGRLTASVWAADFKITSGPALTL